MVLKILIALSAVVAIINTAFCFLTRGETFFQSSAAILGNIYANTLLAVFNSRVRFIRPSEFVNIADQGSTYNYPELPVSSALMFATTTMCDTETHFGTGDFETVVPTRRSTDTGTVVSKDLERWNEERVCDLSSPKAPYFGFLICCSQSSGTIPLRRVGSQIHGHLSNLPLYEHGNVLFSYEKLGWLNHMGHPNIHLPTQWVMIEWRSGWRDKYNVNRHWITQALREHLLEVLTLCRTSNSRFARSSACRASGEIGFAWSAAVLKSILEYISDKCWNIQPAISRNTVKPVVMQSPFNTGTGRSLLMKVGITLARHIRGTVFRSFDPGKLSEIIVNYRHEWNASS